MAPQAKEEHGHFADLLNLLRGFAQTHYAEQKKVGHADRGVNLQIKVLVQSNNLFRLKDGLGPCLVDANNTQLVLLHGKLLPRMPLIQWIGAYRKGAWGEGVSLSRLKNIAEATFPV
jgi:hypothetical protein